MGVGTDGVIGDQGLGRVHGLGFGGGPVAAGAGELAYQQVQHDTAQAHMAWQSTMSQAHQAYLQTVETSFRSMAGAPPLAVGAQASPSLAPAVFVPAVLPAAMPEPARAPVMAATPDLAPVAASSIVPLAQQPGISAPEVVQQHAVQDVGAILIEVVADKTGYPAEMLGMDMALEADLGIDSIKRVEILSAVQERLPDLPGMDTNAMASMKTLGQIADLLRGQLGQSSAARQSRPARTTSGVGAQEDDDDGLRPARYAVRLLPVAPSGLALGGLRRGRRVPITEDGRGVAEALVRELCARGLPAVLASRAEAPDADAVLDLCGLRAVETREEALAGLFRYYDKDDAGFRNLLDLVRQQSGR